MPVPLRLWLSASRTVLFLVLATEAFDQEGVRGAQRALHWCGPTCGDKQDQQVVTPEGRVHVRYPARPWEMLRYGVTTELLEAGHLTWPGMARIWSGLAKDWSTAVFHQVTLQATSECFPGHQFLRLASAAQEIGIPSVKEQEDLVADLVQDVAAMETALCGGWPIFALLALLAGQELADGTGLSPEVRGMPQVTEVMNQLKLCTSKACLQGLPLLEVQRFQSLALHGFGTCPRGSVMAWMDELDPVPVIPLCVRIDKDVVSDTIKRQGKWPECYELFGIVEVVGWKDCVVLDVGANMGSCSMVLMRSGFQVMAFEPLPSSAGLLRASLRFNEGMMTDRDAGKGPFSGVAQLAVGEPSEAVVVEAYNNSGGSYVTSPVNLQSCNRSSHNCEKAQSVHVVSLDEVLTAYGINKVCLLKIDTEGAELRVLRSAQEWLRKRLIGVVYFEWRPLQSIDRGEDPFEILNFLEALNYRIFASTQWFADDKVFSLPSVQQWMSVQREQWDEMLEKKGNLLASPK